jgi:hypothetical protein
MSNHIVMGSRLVVLWLLPLAAGARSLAAQTTCSGREPIGWLGVSSLACSNCYVAYPGEGRPSLFSTEPRIASVASSSPAAAVLREGDVLVGIDDQLITTHAAGQRLANLKPGDAVWVEVRRNGELLRYRFGNLPPICPSDTRVLGARARPGGFAVGAGGRGGRVEEISPEPASRIFTPPLLPRASFGFGIACSRCVGRYNDDGTLIWEFDEFPEIYSVETQSQAYRAGIRRGDLITRIDDFDITSEEGGRRFGRVQAGQNVRFTIRRGSTNMTRELVAQARGRAESAGASARAVQTENSLREARDLIAQIRQQEARERDQIDQLRRHEERQMRELADRLLAQQVEQTRRLNELHSELERIERIRAQVGQATVVTPRVSGIQSVRNRNIIRYSGKLGETDVEVRGPAGVDIIETRDEIIITTSDSTIRLKRSSR